MKTVVFIPNDLFEAAERLARRTYLSRCRVFSDVVNRHHIAIVALATNSLPGSSYRHGPGEE
jgi:hypothetical protein